MEKTVTQNNPDRRDRKNPDRLTEGDFAADKMGNNDLQGNDQQEVRNERHALPGEKREAEGLIERFENADPRVRAERERAGRKGG